MSLLYIYFGDDSFNKLECVNLSEGKEVFQSKLASGLAFDSVSAGANEIEVVDFFPSWSYVLFQADNALYCCGFKDFSCDGKVTKIFDASNYGSIRNVSCSWNNILLVTKDGMCFSCSTNDFHLTAMNEILANKKVQNVSAGDVNNFILTEDNKVYLLKGTDLPYNLTTVSLSCKVQEVACGKEHYLFLSQSGEVYSCGLGSRGQLGHGDTNSQDAPLIIEALHGVPVRSIVAGGWHSAAISVFGDLYTWGWNESGQLGFPCSQRKNNSSSSEEIEVVCCTPKLLNLMPDVSVKTVSCGSRHTAALSEHGHFWTWGFNGYGQLGTPKCPWVDSPSLVLLPSNFQPQKLKCSFWSTVVSGYIKSN